MKRFFLCISLLFCCFFNSQASNVSDIDKDSTHKPVTVTLRVPQPGVYAVSVVDKDIVSLDTIQPNIISTMLDNSAFLKNVNDTAHLKYGFEQEQVISGKVKRAFVKVKNPQIIVLNPATGDCQDYSLDHHQSFNLIGYDIQEGGRLTIQATKEDGTDNIVELQITDPYFPNLSMNTYLKSADTLSFPPVNDRLLTETKHNKVAKQEKLKKENYAWEIDLKDVMVITKKIKPLNRLNVSPDYGFTYHDPVLSQAKSLDMLLTALGFDFRYGDGQKYVGRYCLIRTGWKMKVVFIVPTIYIDNYLIADIEELWSLDPKDIRQLECFTNDEGEAPMALEASKAGALCIFTKSGRRRHNTLSMQSVHPLGYRAAKSPYNPLQDALYEADNDHRATLLWNPALIVDSTCTAQITFMPSTASSHYTVSLEGIGNGGDISCSLGMPKGKEVPELSESEEKQVTAYLEKTAREKAYIQTDRSQYCAGDTVWFRVHIADAFANIPSTSPEYPTDRSKFVYLEIHNNNGVAKENGKSDDNTLLERVMIKRDSLGVFSSYFVIPEELPSGNLTLVAYTRYMLNFPEEQFTHKQIQVVATQ